MRVKLHEVDQTTDMVTVAAEECDLAECFPEDPDEARHTEAQLRKDGYAYVGGGAAQLFLLTVALPH